MHHWTTATYKTIMYDRPDNISLLTLDLPRSALAHEYLLDGIFSFTALHLAFENQADSLTAEYYLSAAISIRDRGLQRVAPALQEFHLRDGEREPREVFAMFWFSVLAGMVTMALTVVTQRIPSSADLPGAPAGKAFISMQVEIAQLWRGTRAIMDIASSIGSGEELLSYPSKISEQHADEIKLEPEIESRMTQLEGLIDKFVPDSPPSGSDSKTLKDLYHESANIMRRGFYKWAADGTLDDLMSWGPRLGNDFASLLKEGAPLALLSALCYGTLLEQISHKWWAAGAGKALVDECSMALVESPEEWHDLIRWARGSVNLPSSPAASTQLATG